jgi:hypothetical protein
MKVTAVALVSGLLLLAAAPASLASRNLAQAGNGIGSQAASAAGNALGLPRIPGVGSGSSLPGVGSLTSGVSGGLNNITGSLRGAVTGLTQRLGLNGTNATSLERCIALLDSYNITLVNGTTGEPLTGANATAAGNATVSCACEHVLRAGRPCMSQAWPGLHVYSQSTLMVV